MKGTHWFYERGEGDADPRPLTLASIMTSSVKALKADQLVGDAIRLVMEGNVRHIPITDDDGSTVGLVTETDLLRKVLHGRTMSREEEYHAFLDSMLPLSEIMVKEIDTLPPDAKIAEAVHLFLNKRIRCVPVVDENKRVVGIVTESDLMRLLEHMVRD